MNMKTIIIVIVKLNVIVIALYCAKLLNTDSVSINFRHHSIIILIID